MRLPRLRRALAAAYAVPVALALVLAGCVNFVGLDDRLDDEEVRLERAWRDWRDLDIYDYEFVVRRDCFCDAQTQRPVRVVVNRAELCEEGQVRSREPVDCMPVVAHHERNEAQ